MKRFVSIFVFFCATVSLMAQGQKSFVVADKDGNSPLVESLIFQKSVSDDKFSWKTATENNGYQEYRDIRFLNFIARTNVELQTADSNDIINMLEGESGKDGVNANAIATSLQSNPNISDAYTADGKNLVVEPKNANGNIIFPMYDLSPMFDESVVSSNVMSQISVPKNVRNAPYSPSNQKIAIFNSLAGDPKYSKQNELVQEIVIMFGDHGYQVESYPGRMFTVDALDNVIKNNNQYDAIIIMSHGYCRKDDKNPNVANGMLVTGEECSLIETGEKFCYNGKYYRTHPNTFKVKRQCLVYIGSCYGGYFGETCWDSSKSNADNNNEFSFPYGDVPNLLEGIIPGGNLPKEVTRLPADTDDRKFPNKEGMSLIAWRGVNAISQAHAALLFHRVLNEKMSVKEALAMSFLNDPIHNTGLFFSNNVLYYGQFEPNNNDDDSYYEGYSIRVMNRSEDIAVKRTENTQSLKLRLKMVGNERFDKKFGTRNITVYMKPLFKYTQQGAQILETTVSIADEGENSRFLNVEIPVKPAVGDGIYEVAVRPYGISDKRYIRIEYPIYVVYSSKFGDNFVLPTYSDEDNRFPSIIGAGGQRVEAVEVAAGSSKEFTIEGYPGHTFFPTVANSNIAQLSIEGTKLTVTGVSEGKTYARVTDMDNKLFFIFDVTVTKGTPADNHEYVDLGLPSGTLWASCNVGATKPEEYGDYFAWGETKPKEVYNWDTYFDSSFDKYNVGGGLTELDLEDDAAYVNWGSSWRMPSLDQIKELIDNCNWEWTTLNGVYGRKATSKKNGNSIFLPAAGWRYDASLSYAGSSGYYWSRSLHTSSSSHACYLGFYSGNVYWGDYYLDRYDGPGVRPVRQK